MNEAAKIWAEAIKETGIWLSPFADNVAELGQLIIPRMQQALDAARAEERERDARIADEHSAHYAKRDRRLPPEMCASAELACDDLAAAIRNRALKDK